MNINGVGGGGLNIKDISSSITLRTTTVAGNKDFYVYASGFKANKKYFVQVSIVNSTANGNMYLYTGITSGVASTSGYLDMSGGGSVDKYTACSYSCLFLPTTGGEKTLAVVRTNDYASLSTANVQYKVYEID